MKNTVLKLSAVALTATMAMGCANGDLRTMVENAQATADQAAQDASAARSAAEAARTTADRASQMASSAQSTASQAMSAAQSAQSCCDANRERLERMFQRSMSK